MSNTRGESEKMISKKQTRTLNESEIFIQRIQVEAKKHRVKIDWLIGGDLCTLVQSLEGVEHAKLSLTNLFCDKMHDAPTLLKATLYWLDTCFDKHVGWAEYNAAVQVAHQLFYHYGQRQLRKWFVDKRGKMIVRF